ncbi:MAG: alpha/beta hydrolase [SAR324 cluster bacterium]|nr:alpha/beta hydrolase [SAR324 cluster bacterium]
MTERKIIYFAHGLESGPWGSKIQYLAEIGRSHGFEVESPDYAGMMDPNQRVEKLLKLVALDADCLVLAGSSMGGWVSLEASSRLNPTAIFLLAPAVYVGYLVESEIKEAPPPYTEHLDIVHGWHDDTVPVDGVIRFAKEHQARLHLLNSGHRLMDQLPTLGKLFSNFLTELL